MACAPRSRTSPTRDRRCLNRHTRTKIPSRRRRRCVYFYFRGTFRIGNCTDAVFCAQVNRSKAKDAFQDPFATSPLPHRRDFTVLQTAGLSGAFLDAAKKDAKVNARSHNPFDTNDSAQTGGLTANNSAVIKATVSLF